MRIIYLWDADYPWDVRTEKVCSALTRAGHEVHIVARNRTAKPVRERLPEGEVHRLHPWRWAGRRLDALLSFPAFFSPRWVRRLREVATKVDADLIIVRDLPLCPTAIHVARGLDLPVVLDMAENYAAMMREIWDAGRQRPWDVLVRNPKIVAAVERWCLPRLDAVIVVIEESGHRLERLGVPASRITVVSNTPPRARAEAPLARSNDKSGPVEIVYLGLLELPRGVGELLDAAAMCVDAGAAIHLTIVGDGRDGEILRQRASALRLGDAVRFTGRLAHSDALAAVAAADIGVVPHHADEAWNTTIPNKLFDYMAAGLAVISSDAEPAARVLRQAGGGVVFRSGDAESLRAAITTLLDPDVRDRMAQAGREAVRTRFNWEHDTAALLDLVRRFQGAGAATEASPVVAG